MHDHTARGNAPGRAGDGSGLGRVLGEISRMAPEDLREVRAALTRRTRELKASTVAERRGFRDGVLQLEYRLGRGGAMRGPYWYYRYRRDGAQNVLYLGRTDEPELLAAEKLEGRGPG